MAAHDLQYAVVVTSPEGEYVTIAPGTEIPAWAKEQIGDHAFALTPKDAQAEQQAAAVDEDGQPKRRARKTE